MARKYSRDNRGRFASVGATARGGRLRTASGKKRETQTAKIKGGPASGTIGKPKGLKPGAKAAPSAATIAQVGRERRATRNLNAAMKREGDGPSSKASRSASVAKRARAIYAGKVDPKQKTAARLTKTTDAEALRKRVKKIKDNNAAKPAARRADRAEANIPMRGARGRRLDAEITRNVNAQKAQERAADKARNRQAKTEMSRAKKLRDAHIGSIAKAKGLSKGQVESALKAQPASTQIKALKNWVKVNRAAAKPAAAKPGAIKGARLGGTRQTTRAAAPRNTTPNRTGQSKTLNRFNSRPIGTMVAGKGDKLVPSTKRVPLNINLKESDLAFARIATKASRARAAAPAKAEAKQITANRASRAAANQKRVTQAVLAKGGRRPTPTKKQRRSIMTAEAAKRFYATRAVDTLKVNVKKPGFRLPR